MEEAAWICPACGNDNPYNRESCRVCNRGRPTPLAGLQARRRRAVLYGLPGVVVGGAAIAFGRDTEYGALAVLFGIVLIAGGLYELIRSNWPRRGPDAADTPMS